MNRYQPSTSRGAFGLAAVAMTALTFALAVVAPSAVRSDQQPEAATTLARDGSGALIEVMIIPARIDVIATREPKLAAGRAQARASDASVAPAI